MLPLWMMVAVFFGATPEDVSLMHVEVSSGNLYSFGLQQ